MSEPLINYYYNPEHPLKPYTYWAQANPNSLPPRNAIRVKPKEKAGYVPVLNKYGTDWDHVLDARGSVIYSTVNQSSRKMEDIGDIPADYTLVPPPSSYHTWNKEEKRWVLTKEDEEKAAADKLKADLEIQSARIDRMLITCERNISELEEIRDEAEELGLEGMTPEEEEELKTWKRARITLRRMDRTVLHDESEFPVLPNNRSK